MIKEGKNKETTIHLGRKWHEELIFNAPFCLICPKGFLSHFLQYQIVKVDCDRNWDSWKITFLFQRLLQHACFDKALRFAFDSLPSPVEVWTAFGFPVSIAWILRDLVLDTVYKTASSFQDFGHLRIYLIARLSDISTATKIRGLSNMCSLRIAFMPRFFNIL